MLTLGIGRVDSAGQLAKGIRNRAWRSSDGCLRLVRVLVLVKRLLLLLLPLLGWKLRRLNWSTISCDWCTVWLEPLLRLLGILLYHCQRDLYKGCSTAYLWHVTVLLHATIVHHVRIVLLSRLNKLRRNCSLVVVLNSAVEGLSGHIRILRLCDPSWHLRLRKEWSVLRPAVKAL